MISWETVGVSAAITLIFAIAILLVIRKSDEINTKYTDSIRDQNLNEIFDEQTERRDADADIREKMHEIDVSHGNRIDELDKALNDERQLRIKSNAELLDSVGQQFKQISFQSERIDILSDHTNDLDKKFNDVLIAKSVEHPETFRSRATEGRCVFCGKKVDPVFIMPLMINTKALTYANGQELYTCEECYKKFDQFIAGRRVNIE